MLNILDHIHQLCLPDSIQHTHTNSQTHTNDYGSRHWSSWYFLFVSFCWINLTIFTNCAYLVVFNTHTQIHRQTQMIMDLVVDSLDSFCLWVFVILFGFILRLFTNSLCVFFNFFYLLLFFVSLVSFFVLFMSPSKFLIVIINVIYIYQT